LISKIKRDVDYKRYDVIKLLLDSGADINMIYNTNKKKLDFDPHNYRFFIGLDDEKVVYNDESCVPIIFIDNIDGTDRDFKIIKLLLTYNLTIANLNQTFVALASNCRGHNDLINILIEKGANINFQDLHGTTALMMACFDGNLQLVKMLLSYHADINLKKNCGATALLYACGYCTDEIPYANHEIIRLLLNLSPDISLCVSDVQDEYGNTPLFHYCVQYNYDIEILKTLCQKSNLDHKNKRGETALMLCCHDNVDIEVIKTMMVRQH
jgi:ankyrin repeat protein